MINVSQSIKCHFIESKRQFWVTLYGEGVTEVYVGKGKTILDAVLDIAEQYKKGSQEG